MEQLNNSLFSEKTIWHTVLCNSSSVTHQGWWEYKVAPHLGSFLSNEAVSYQMKPTFIIWLNNPTRGCLSKMNKNTCPQKSVYNVHSFIHHSPKLERAQISTNRQTDQYIVMCPYNRILCNNTKEQATNTHNNIDEFPKFMLSRRLMQEYTLWDSMYMKFYHSKCQSTVGRKWKNHCI